jgi:hypothetical protein
MKGDNVSEETKKGIERDLSCIAMDVNNEPVWNFRDFDEKFVEGVGYQKIPKEGSKYSMTLAEYCALILERNMQDDKQELVDQMKRVKLARRLRKYGSKPISFKMDNWIYIRDRLLKAKVPATVLIQYEEIINGAKPEDEEDL